MSRRTLIALLVAFLIVVPLGLGAIAVLKGGDDSRIVGAISAARADEYERSYGTHLYRVAPGGGQFLGQVRAMSGCGKEAAVTLAVDANGAVTKQPSATSLTPCVLSFTRMRDPFYSMLGEILAGNAGRPSFWLVNPDRTGVPQTGIHIQDALVEVSLSNLDGDALDEELVMDMTLRPTAVTEYAACCGTFTPSGPTGSTHQAIFVNGFAATVSGITGGQDIGKISGLSFRQEAAGANVALRYGDPEIVVLRHPTGGFRQWFTDFAVNGQNSAANEKTMTIQIKAGTVTKFTLTFSGVGVRSWEPLGLSSFGNAGSVIRDRFGLYVEGAALALGAPPPAPPPTPPPPATTPTPPPPAPNPAPTTTSAAPTVPVEPPSPPTGVTAEVGEAGTVVLAWDPVKGADGYVILSSSRSGGTYAPLAETRDPGYTATRLEPGTTVFFVIRAVRGGSQSKSSEELEVAIK